MEIFLTYLRVFVCGGLVCIIGQLLINYTKMTTARILVVFLLSGVLLQALNLFEPFKAFAGSGATIPIIGFGHVLAKGAMEGAKQGLLGAITGGIKAASMGLTAAIFFGYLNALLFKSRTKK